MDIHQYLTKEEIKKLTTRSDWRGAWEVLKTWLWIGGAFAVVGYYPSVFTVVPALFVLGGKQLACAIIMHDASHRALFKTLWLNDIIGNWLGGYLIINDLTRYRPYHLKHHNHTGTPQDPDLPLTKGYPATVASFLRKITRDLAGLTGLKGQVGMFLMNIGYWRYNLGGKIERIQQAGKNGLAFLRSGAYHYSKPLIANFLLWFVLWCCGAGWLYALWVLAFLTTFQFSLRVRSIAEHSVVPNPLDNQQNTRTTYANYLERLLFAPHFVNYHAEHHALMSVPPYNLPAMHRLMKARGFYEKGLLAPDYWQIIKLAMSKPARTT